MLVILYILKIAGDGKGSYIRDTKFEGQSFKWGTELVTPDGLPHVKPCACGSSYDQKTKKFYETGKQVSATDIKISDKYQQSVQGYEATWKSTDGHTYQHYGYAINDQPNKPNHS